MSKHTPAPWEHNDYQIIAGETVIANCTYGARNSNNANDARLIAAAPELLEVVQKFVAWSEAERDPSGTTFWQRVEMCREVDALASAAIAKAEGQ